MTTLPTTRKRAPAAMSVAAAARALNVTPRAVRRWITQGAPCVRPGEPGRGRGALVNVEELRRWRYGSADIGAVIDAIAEELLDAARRDIGFGAAAHELLGIRTQDAAKLYLAAFQRIHRRLTGGSDPAALPEAIQVLFTMANRPPGSGFDIPQS